MGLIILKCLLIIQEIKYKLLNYCPLVRDQTAALTSDGGSVYKMVGEHVLSTHVLEDDLENSLHYLHKKTPHILRRFQIYQKYFIQWYYQH